VVVLWTHCRRRASGREQKRNGLDTGENPALKKTENGTNEFTILLKTNGGNLKRTQNELETNSNQVHNVPRKCRIRALSHRSRSGWALVRRECVTNRSCPVDGDPQARERIQKQREQSQGVIENKGYRFFLVMPNARISRAELRKFSGERSKNSATWAKRTETSGLGRAPGSDSKSATESTLKPSNDPSPKLPSPSSLSPGRGKRGDRVTELAQALCDHAKCGMRARYTAALPKSENVLTHEHGV